MTDLTPETFCAQPRALLCDQPLGCAARLNDFSIAWWNGEALVLAYLRDDSEQIDEEFDLRDCLWDEWRGELEQWCEAPQFTHAYRQQLPDWIQRAPGLSHA